MNLIERYVREVGRRLPSRQRDDVQKELRSTLQDALDDRLGDTATDDARVESATVAVLREFGRPEELAASYVGPRYLIGPELYAPFMTTLRIVLGVVLGLVLIGWLIGNGMPGTPRALAMDFVELFTELFDSALGLVGLIVVVFAILQQIALRREEPNVAGLLRESHESVVEEGSWDPRTLPETKDEDRIDRGEEIVGLCFVVVGLVLVNFAPDKIGAFVSLDGDGAWIPFFGPSAQDHVPLFNLIFGGWLVTAVWLLRQGRWNLGLRLLDLLLMLGCVLLIRGALGDADLVQRDAAWFQQHGMTLENAGHLADTVVPIVHIIWRVGLWLLLVLSGWSALTKAWRIWKQWQA